MNEAAAQLRTHFAPSQNGKLKAVGTKEAGRKTKEIFNQQIAGVTTKPTEGAIELTIDEAEAFLGPHWQQKAFKSAGAPRRGGDTAATGGGFSDAMKRRGVERVYVVPERYNAMHHESLIKKLKPGSEDNQANRELGALQKSAYQDRDARAGGAWSKMQAEHESWISKAKGEEELVAPGGDAHRALTSLEEQRAGELPLLTAARAAADRAGVREQLDQFRMLSPMGNLQSQASVRKPSGIGGAPTMWGAANAAADAGMLRFGYPAMKALEGPLGPLSRGKAGRVGTVGRDEKEERK